MCLDIVSARKRSRLGLVSDTRGSRLGLVSDSLANVSVSSRSRELRSRSWSRSRPRRSWAHPCWLLLIFDEERLEKIFKIEFEMCCLFVNLSMIQDGLFPPVERVVQRRPVNRLRKSWYVVCEFIRCTNFSFLKKVLTEKHQLLRYLKKL